MIIVDLAIQYWLLWLILAIASLALTIHSQLKFMSEGIVKLDFAEALGKLRYVILFGLIFFISGLMLLIAIVVGILRAV